MKLEEDFKQQVLDLWVSKGKPLIHIADGINCFDLEQMIEPDGILAKYGEAVIKWYEENKVRIENK